MPPVPPQKVEFPKFVDSLWCVYIVSVASAFNAEFVTYPLDLVKTRLQIQGEQSKNGKLGQAPHRGLMKTALGIVKEEGVRKLWQGIHAAFARHMIYSGTRIITYKALKDALNKRHPEHKHFPLWQSALCGVSAGAFAQYLASPTDLIKVQIQMEGKRRLLGLPPRVNGMFDAFQKVWSTGGIRGLWKVREDHQANNYYSRESYFLKAKQILYKRVHILQWLPNYTKNDIMADFISGLTVGLTMMPQSIAYASLAGVDPQYGLYSAFIGSFTYIFFGTIREVSIGPTSLMSLLTATYTIGKPIECVILLTLIAGFVELLMGVLKLGFLVDFISPSLSSGFTSATSLIITLSQMKNVFGLKINSHNTIGIVKEFSQKYRDIKWPDTIMSLTCFVVLICFKKLLPKIKTRNQYATKIMKFMVMAKNAITVLLASLVAAYLHYNGGSPFKLTGKVPRGLPAFAFPALTTKFGNETVGYQEMVSSLSSGVIVVPVVAVLANVAIAKAYSQDAVVDASQEMISLGLCNIFGSFVHALPTCGAFTRSAVASSSDVRTPLQGLYSGSVILLALSLLSPYFYFIPKSALAAVLIIAASSLVDYEIFPVLWRCNKVDFALAMSTFILGTLFGVEIALIIASLCNILVLLRVWSRPKIHIEKRSKSEDGDQQYLYIKPELGLYYVGADHFSETIKKAHKANDHLTMIVIDCANILRLDYSAAKHV